MGTQQCRWIAVFRYKCLAGSLLTQDSFTEKPDFGLIIELYRLNNKQATEQTLNAVTVSLFRAWSNDVESVTTECWYTYRCTSSASWYFNIWQWLEPVDLFQIQEVRYSGITILGGETPLLGCQSLIQCPLGRYLMGPSTVCSERPWYCSTSGRGNMLPQWRPWMSFAVTWSTFPSICITGITMWPISWFLNGEPHNMKLPIALGFWNFHEVSPSFTPGTFTSTSDTVELSLLSSEMQPRSYNGLLSFPIYD